ncbi:hypothetical protein ACERZ8_03495 [Tateyamaria armeniaca]|uniref:Uncharacterized protein n=1 Tax=Tateyamaria armeniaca TaxID=2518930 RepID=A0ABW8UPV0_9RHOB
MNEISAKELAEGDVDLWINWLREGVILYSAEAPTPVRFRAFSPLLVDPDSVNPAGDLVAQIRTIHLANKGVAGAAAVEALRTWSPALDGWQGAVLLLSISARLGGRGVADAGWNLIARSQDLPPDARAELAYVAVEAAKLRYKYTELVSLIELLWSEDLATPQLLAKLALLLARQDNGGLEMLPNRLATIMPALVEPPHSHTFVREIAAALRSNFGVEDLRTSLRPIEGEDEKIAEFRRVLLHLSHPGNVLVLNLSPSAKKVAAQRLSGLKNLTDMSFPEFGDAEDTDGSETPQ